jgi:ABC-type transport system involved in cytochrome c biogenesis ATPase subunit
MAAALEITNLQAWYGESHILHNVNLTVNQGEVVTLLGRNGAGRTTTLRAIMGLTGKRSGSIKVGGVEAIGLPTHKIAHLGIGYCPEERGIFSSLSAEENLMLPPALNGADKGMSVQEIYQMFPNLYERRNSQGTRLSGGEQQMLAVARISASPHHWRTGFMSSNMARLSKASLHRSLMPRCQFSMNCWAYRKLYGHTRNSPAGNNEPAVAGTGERLILRDAVTWPCSHIWIA